MDKDTFQQEVYNVVAAIPPGRVVTYGQIAYLVGRPQCQYVDAICPERTIFLGIAASHEDRSLEGKLCSPPAGLA